MPSATILQAEVSRLKQQLADLTAELERLRQSVTGPGEASRSDPDLTVGRARTQQLEWLANNMSECFVIWNAVLDERGKLVDIQFVYFNRAYEFASGLKLDQVRGKTVREIWPTTEEAWFDAYREVLSTGQPKSFDLYHGASSGFYACTAYRPPEATNHLYVVFHEASEYHRILKQIGDLTNEQHILLDTVVGGISRVRCRKMQWVNKALARMFGYETHELLGMDSAMLYAHSEDYDRVGREGYAQLAKGEVYSTEAEMKTRDGRLIWCCITGQALNPSNLEEGTIWELQDISERQRATMALRESEQRFRRLVQYSNDVIVVTDGNGTQLSVYGPSDVVLGYAPEQMVGTSCLQHLHPEDVEPVKSVLSRVALCPDVAGRVECRFRHQNGAWIPMELVGTNLLQDPIICGLVINCREISERKNAELERQKLQDQLQQAMKMEAVGRLAGGIAHDFNNLLTAIAGNIELAKLDLAPSDPLMAYLDEANKAAQSASSLTRQLLAFSRKQIIEPKVVNINHLIEALRKMLMRIIGEDIALETVLANDVGCVRVDPGQFDQVLVNLVVNARDAMPDGGKLVIETSNLELDQHYCRRHPDVQPGDYVLLSVTDTGHGMDESIKKRLFEPFFTTKPLGRGTGLGLATIFGAIKQAGGTIDVYSEVGLGTTFKVFLPKVERSTRIAARQTEILDLPRGDETVLLVEDEASVRELTHGFLKRLGYDVLWATNASEALLVAESHGERLDLLMTDVIMPGMNGRDLAERLRSLRPNIKVLFTSGYAENVVVHRGVVDEKIHFIAKPYSLQALAAKIREVLKEPVRE